MKKQELPFRIVKGWLLEDESSPLARQTDCFSFAFGRLLKTDAQPVSRREIRILRENHTVMPVILFF
ncbi:hypothetical protein HMPREF9135_2489 [Segatella baroniae F0067]|uniref:Uncharacterized protein n=1 Tax=Segatella baroniae F0067 TaxID=1115809 RepID=U2QNQ8_9BACT|nr:hypothetical protein [Segatella baroniae]ERK40412.1 hypothetical protein HMPREF9135_2489 [Segatella baroniae F0067]